MKVEYNNLGGLLQPIPIPECIWDFISMEFITGLPRTGTKHDSIIVVVDRLRKVTHLILVNTTYSASEEAHVFIREIVILHDVPKTIMLDMDSMFTSNFWKEFLA